MILLFLTSGLFLGWSLGANDASHIFGSAVGSKMVVIQKSSYNCFGIFYTWCGYPGIRNIPYSR